MSGSGFFKGEKKKPKKDKQGKAISISSAPTFTLPKVIIKKKNEQ
jgi:hypothetical protein